MSNSNRTVGYETEGQESVKVLSLDGGGVRGLFTISVLAEIESIIARQTGNENVKIGDYFDLLTGTSIGGILALGLAAGKSARELQKVFYDQASLIFPSTFPGRWFNTIKSIFTPLYSSEPLRKTVENMIGSSTIFNDLERRVLIPTVSLTTGKSQFFKTPHNGRFNRDGSLKLVDAAMATAAAPTYFAPHYCAERNAYFADGGLVANNTSFVGLLEVLRDMRDDFPSASYNNVHILNVGTLGEEYTIRPKTLGRKWNKGYLGLWAGGKRLVLTTMSATQRLHKDMLMRELSSCGADKNYVYLDDTLSNDAGLDISLDNASPEALKTLAGRGKQLASEEFARNKPLQAFFKTSAKPFKSRTHMDTKS
ncbi:hypothetical protein DFO83_102107 [Idiomarina loihiensis]|uniref:CBASS cGAMP-activated phospholipase n=1 Tax=Idiomarina TaxID=135575 RepID=UPI000D717CFE|nr:MULTISPECIES: CBASS cGAMP-activated phospholipase [Idiomarina]PWW40289.1 hypothetical protein DFO83_102107 [Idiomarina loihiensis]TDP49980.1 hypothetical protein DET58_102103 [Idiomarina loihiensis]TDS24668.1 hypothetical protein DET62_102277 [Idiomarina sp. H2]